MAGRRPIASPGYVQRMLWAEMRKLRRFTVPQLCPDRSQFRAAYDYLDALTAAGIVCRYPSSDASAGRFAPYLYVLERDPGVDAPRLRRDGTPIVFGLAREQLWRSIRILREFNVRELTVVATTPAAPVSEANATRYVLTLRRAGYLCCVRPSAPGRLARYRLLLTHNTGPHPPIVQTNGCLYDPNLGRMVWQPPLAAEHGDG